MMIMMLMMTMITMMIMMIMTIMIMITIIMTPDLRTLVFLGPAWPHLSLHMRANTRAHTMARRRRIFALPLSTEGGWDGVFTPRMAPPRSGCEICRKSNQIVPRAIARGARKRRVAAR